MSSGNLGTAVLIIFIIMLIHFFLTASIGIAHIQNNWQEYKCKPGIVPFASVFGYDTGDNFRNCVKDVQVDFMEVFLEPIYGSLEFFANSGSKFAQIFQDVKVFGNAQESATMGLQNSISGRFMGIISETNILYLNVVDTFSKLSQAITMVYYAALSGLKTGEAMGEELPGTMLSLAGNFVGA